MLENFNADRDNLILFRRLVDAGEKPAQVLNYNTLESFYEIMRERNVVEVWHPVGQVVVGTMRSCYWRGYIVDVAYSAGEQINITFSLEIPHEGKFGDIIVTYEHLKLLTQGF